MSEPTTPLCRATWFCDEKPDESGLCHLHRCIKEGCTNPRHLLFGVCLDHCEESYRIEYLGRQALRKRDSVP